MALPYKYTTAPPELLRRWKEANALDNRKGEEAHRLAQELARDPENKELAAREQWARQHNCDAYPLIEEIRKEFKAGGHKYPVSRQWRIWDFEQHI